MEKVRRSDSEIRSYNFCFKWKTPENFSRSLVESVQSELLQSAKALDQRLSFTKNQFEDPDLWIISFKSRRSIKKTQEALLKYCFDIMPDFIDLRIKHGQYSKLSLHRLLLNNFLGNQMNPLREMKIESTESSQEEKCWS